jgi:RimJ/RimL family protein N-acetyltransferase
MPEGLNQQIVPVRLSARGEPVSPVNAIPAAIAAVLAETRNLYERERYEAPWISYLATRSGMAVGLGAFKSPPRDGRVEIAYMTAPAFEGQGVATAIARELVAVARGAAPDIVVAAQTLREKNASVAILRKLDFSFFGEVHHPEDGLVWEWRLRSSSSARGRDIADR